MRRQTNSKQAKDASGHSKHMGRALRIETLEKRTLLSADFRNPVDNIDVSGDGMITSLDALLVINDLSRNGPGELPAVKPANRRFVDVDGDGRAFPIDALRVINAVSRNRIAGFRTLTDQNTFETQQSFTIGLGQTEGARIYRMQIDANFGTPDSNSLIPDLFSVYLVDPIHSSQTLLDRGQNGTSLFALSPRGTELATGLARWDGSVLELDLSSIADTDAGRLRIQLVNGDSTSNTTVVVRPLTNAIDSDRQPSQRFSTQSAPISPAAALDIASLTASTTVQAAVENIRFDAASGQFIAEIEIANLGAAIGRDVALRLRGLPTGVTLQNASGMDGTGTPYLNLRDAIGTGGLGQNKFSNRVQLQISNPARSLFTLQPSVLVGQANRAPLLTAIPTQTVMPGDRVEIQLEATDADNDALTYSLTGDVSLPQGSLQSGSGRLVFTPTPTDVGTFQVEVTASDGALTAARTFTLNVIADPITTTRISGRVLDVDETPLVGIQVELGAVRGLTRSDGSFQLDLGSGPLAGNTLKVRGETFVDPARPDVVYPFIAEKLPLLFDHDTYVGYNNVISRPIFLPKLDMANGQTIDPTQITTVTTAAIPGTALTIAAGSLMNQAGTAFTGVLSITEVPPDLTPAVLPVNLFPDLVVTIQPGDMVFTTPAPLSLPNRSGWAAGTPMDLWSINPVTGEFEDVGDMQVSADGATVNTTTGGVRNSSWHFTSPRPPMPKPKPDNDSCEECEATAPANSDVNFNSGALTEEHELVTYQSLGQTRGVTLNYDSVRADARPIVHFAYDEINPNIFSVPDALKVVARLSVNLNGVEYVVPGFADAPQFGLRGGEHFFSIPAGGGPLDAALQADLRGQPTGTYTYTLSAGTRGFTGTAFIGSEDVSRGQLIHVNTVDSPFGSGWGVDGLQELVQNADGSLLLVDGNGSASLFSKAPDARRDLLALGKSNNILRYNETTGAFEGTFAAAGLGGLNDPKDAVFGPDGNLYVTNFGGKNILRFDGQSGAFIDVFVEQDSGGLSFPTVLEFGPDGNLYVGQGGPGNIGGGGNVLRYNGSTGAFIDVFADAKAIAGLDLINGLTFGPDGHLYVTSTDRAIFTNTDRVLRFNGSTGAFLDTFVAPAQLDDAGALTFGPDGDLYMIDVRFNHVQRYNGTTGAFSGVFTSEGNLSAAFDLQFGPDGNLYVASAGNDQVNQFNGTTGALIGEFVSAGAGGLDFPQAIVFRGPAPGVTSKFVAPPGDFSEIEKMADGTFRRTTPDQTVSTFDINGRIERVTDRNGNQTRYTYDASGLLIEIADPVGLRTTFTYTSGKVATITDPAGRITQFDHDAAGNLIRVTDPDGTERNWEYDADHHMTAETNKRGDREQSFYDEFGRAKRAVRADGSIIEINPGQVQGLYSPGRTMDPANAPDAFRSGSGDASYLDGNGNLIRSVLDAAGQEVSSVDNIGSLPTVERNNQNLIARNTDARGHATDYTYDARGNLLSVQDSISGLMEVGLRYTYDPKFSQVTSQTDELGHQTLFNIDPVNGNVRSITQVIGELGGSDDLVTQLTYTSQGLTDTETDPLGRVTDYDYDELGRLITLTFAKDTVDEGVRRFEYDVAGNLAATTDENGFRTDYAFDSLNRLARITEPDPDNAGPLPRPLSEFAYDAAGNLTSATDALGNISHSEYDSRNRMSKTIDSHEGETSYRYDLAGNRISVTNPLGKTTRYRYDARNRIIETLDPDNGRIEFAYDPDDNITAVTDPNGNRTEFEYDARNRLVKELVQIDGPIYSNNFEAPVGPEWSNTKTEVTPEGNRGFLGQFGNETVTLQLQDIPEHTDLTISFDLYVIRSWDGNGPFGPDVFSVSIADGDEVLRTTFSNTNANANRQAFPNSFPGGSNAPLTGAIQAGTLGYDTCVSCVPNENNDSVYPISLTFPHTGSLLELDFSAIGLQAIADESWGLDNIQVSIRRSRSYEYDVADNIVSQTDRDGRRTEYSYDDVNRRIGELWVDGGNSIAYAYDNANNLLSATDSFSGLAVTYDARDRVRTVNNVATPEVPNVILTYAYDRAGNRLSTADTIAGVAGGVNSYSYDGLDRIIRVTQSGANVSDKRVDLTYNPLGQFDSLQRFQDLSGTQLVIGTDYNYDSLNRLTGLHHRNATNTDVSFFDFSYDANSRITQITNIDGVTDYAYDNRDQLTAAVHSDLDNPDEAYNYDASGNRVSSGSHGNNYVTGLYNRLVSDGVYRYSYDAEGNLTRRNEIATGDYREFTWDYRNRLIAVSDKTAANVETQRVEFTYDVFNRRLSKAVDATPLDAIDSAVSYFVYDGQDVLLDFLDSDGTGLAAATLAQRYLHGPDVDQVLAQDNGEGTVLWQLSDHLGTVHDLVNNSGAVVNHLTYDSYGTAITQTNSAVDSRYQFTGREFDAETGLHYYRARYFDATYGQFISEDPLGLYGGDANVRRYVANSPLTATDPFGLTRCDEIKKELDDLERLQDFIKDALRQLENAIREEPLITDGRGFKPPGVAGVSLIETRGIGAVESSRIRSSYHEPYGPNAIGRYRDAFDGVIRDKTKYFFSRRDLFDLAKQARTDLGEVNKRIGKLVVEADKQKCDCG